MSTTGSPDLLSSLPMQQNIVDVLQGFSLRQQTTVNVLNRMVHQHSVINGLAIATLVLVLAVLVVEVIAVIMVARRDDQVAQP